MNAIPRRMSARSMALARRFRSLKMMAAQVNDTITELRRTSETTEIIDSGSFSDLKYAKSPIQMNMDMRGIAQFHLNAVPWWRFGYHSAPQMTLMIII